MSIILDALKKIEKRKHQGAVPDLLTDHISGAGRRGRRTLWPYLLILALVINAATLAFLFAPTDETPEPEQLIAAAQPDAVKESEAVSKEMEMPAPDISASELAEKAVVTRSEALPARNDVSQSPQAAAAGEAKDSTLQQEITEPAPIPEQPLDNELASLNLDITPQDLDSLRSTIKNEQSALGERQAATGRNSEEPSQAGAGSVIPELSELPAHVREELPRITVSGHIYSNSPGARIATINGRIVREGELLARDLTVDEITVSGIIFRYKEQRFRIRTF